MKASSNAPTAQGTLTKTPLPHLLVYALERSLNGTFELRTQASDSIATLLVIQGFPAKLRTTEEVHFLGDVLHGLGLIGADALVASKERMAEVPRLQGQILLELGAIDEVQLEAGLRAQLDVKLEHLFALPMETTFSYYDGIDALLRYGGQATPIDPFPALWRGVKRLPPLEQVEATLRRVESLGFRVGPAARVDRFRFTAEEANLVERIREKARRFADLASGTSLDLGLVRLLVYILAITKQIDLVDVNAEPDYVDGPHSRPPQATAGESPTTGGQAFARVQLQAIAVQRAPLVVEEAPVPRSAGDGRLASPMPQPIALKLNPAESTAAVARGPVNPPSPNLERADPPCPDGNEAPRGLDVQSMISTTIRSSIRPLSLPASDEKIESAAQASNSQAPQGLAPFEEVSASKHRIKERAASIASQDYFQMLGLERTASPEEVQRAYVALVKVWHPDRLPASLAAMKDDCNRIFTYLSEARATLCDKERRAEYMRLLRDGGATPEDQEKIHAILEAATHFQKAEVCLKRNDTAQALDFAKKARALDGEQADYLAMVTWLEAQKPDATGRERTLEKIAVLDECIRNQAHSERAYFWRGMLHKRIDDPINAVRDFKKATELNPRNLEAQREVRLYNLRAGPSKPPPPGGAKPSLKPQAQEARGGLFGKLFKK